MSENKKQKAPMKDDLRQRLKKQIDYHVKMEKTWTKNMIKYGKNNDTLAAADAASSAEKHLFAALLRMR